jgi:hypothetical protein
MRAEREARFQEGFQHDILSIEYAAAPVRSAS